MKGQIPLLSFQNAGLETGEPGRGCSGPEIPAVNIGLVISLTVSTNKDERFLKHTHVPVVFIPPPLEPEGDGRWPSSLPTTSSCGAGVAVTRCVLSVLFVFRDTHILSGGGGGGSCFAVRHSFGRTSSAGQRKASLTELRDMSALCCRLFRAVANHRGH